MPDTVEIALTADEVIMLSNAILELREIWDWEFPIRTGYSLEEYERLHARLLGLAGRHRSDNTEEEA